MICERCNKKFDLEEDRNEFETETLKCYDYVEKSYVQNVQ